MSGQPIDFDKFRLRTFVKKLMDMGEVAVYDFLDKGYLKEAVLNFVALLGWHPSKSDKELFTLEEPSPLRETRHPRR